MSKNEQKDRTTPEVDKACIIPELWENTAHFAEFILAVCIENGEQIEAFGLFSPRFEMHSEKGGFKNVK